MIPFRGEMCRSGTGHGIVAARDRAAPEARDPEAPAARDPGRVAPDPEAPAARDPGRVARGGSDRSVVLLRAGQTADRGRIDHDPVATASRATTRRHGPPTDTARRTADHRAIVPAPTRAATIGPGSPADGRNDRSRSTGPGPPLSTTAQLAPAPRALVPNRRADAPHTDRLHPGMCPRTALGPPDPGPPMERLRSLAAEDTMS